MKTLKVEGMHCDACKSLIKMELEEAGLDNLVEEMKQEGENQGVVTLKEDASDEDLEKIVGIINGMEKYSVL